MRSKAIEHKSYWLKHVENYKASGLNKHKYCKQQNITYHRFLYWFDKLTSKVSQAVSKNTSKVNQFIKVKLNSEIDQSAQPLCVLELKQGHRLLVHNETSLAENQNGLLMRITHKQIYLQLCLMMIWQLTKKQQKKKEKKKAKKAM